MDKATRNQISILLFVFGFAMVLIQDLKKLDSIDLGFTWPFSLMFYVGLIFMGVGYYIK